GIYGTKPERKPEVTVKMPLFTFTYFDPFENMHMESSKVKIIKPTPVYFMDRILTRENMSKFRTDGTLTLDGETSDILKTALIGEDGKDFVLVPVKSYFYDTDTLNSLVERGIDFDYNNITADILSSRIQSIYKKNPLDDLAGQEKTMHFFPVVLNYRKYGQLLEGRTGVDLVLGDSRWRSNNDRDLFLALLGKMQEDDSGELQAIHSSAYHVHYDYLMKDASGLNPAGRTSNIAFSFIHKLDTMEDAVIQSEDKFVFVQYYCLISTYS